MASTSQGAIGNLNASQTSSIPPPPSLADFSFQTIGKQPELLSRLGDAPPGPNGTGHYDFSPSPSPDLEEQLLMPADSSSGDSDPQQHLSTKRNRLLDALAPDIDVEMGDMDVQDDDVNSNVGANPGPRQMTSSTPLISRVHSGSTSASQSSHGQGPIVPQNSSLHRSPSSGRGAAKISSAKQASAVHMVGAGSALGGAPPALSISGRPPHHPSVPPTPPPDGPLGSSVSRTITPYDSLRSIQTRLQILLDTGVAGSEDFDAIRELAQVAKVESTSVSVASQKAVTLAQRALATAQDAMSASQETVKLSHAAKSRWEAAIQGCEKFMEQRSAKVKQQQDAFKKELSALAENIKSLEEADRKRALQREAERKALEEDRARQADASHQAASTSASMPSLSNAIVPARLLPSAPTRLPQPDAPIAEQQDDNTRQYVLADEFDRLRREVEELRKFSQNRGVNTKEEGNSKSGPDLGRPPSLDGAKPKLDQQQQIAQFQQPSQPTSSLPLPAPPLPYRKAPEPSLPSAKAATDPRALERELKERLKSHKKPSISTSSSSSASSTGLSTPILPDPEQPQQSRLPSSVSLPSIKKEASHVPFKVKAEEEDTKVPPPPLPHRRLPSASSMQLEYPPSSISPSAPPPAQFRPHNPPPLRIPRRGVVPSPVKARVVSAADSDDSPIYLHRLGSDPGNLPIIFPSSTSLTLDTPPHSATSSSSMTSIHFSADDLKPKPVEERVPEVARAPAPAPPRIQIPQTQSFAHPPIATLPSVASPVESSNSSASATAPSVSNTNRYPAKDKDKGKAHRVTSSSSSVSRPPPSAQLPPKPVSVPATPSQATPLTQSAPTQARAAPAPSAATAPAPAQPRSQLHGPLSAPRLPPSRGPENNNRISGPPSSRYPSTAERSYVPSRSPRSPSPTNRHPWPPHPRGVARPPRGDHYSPARARGRSASPPRRSRSPRSRPHSPGFGGRNRSPPRRVMHPYRPSSRERGAPVAGVKRPLDDPAGSNAPAPLRRRVDDPRPVNEKQSAPTTATTGPSPQLADPVPPRPDRSGERSRDVQNARPPAASVRPGAPPPATLHPRQPQPSTNGKAPATLASRLSDAHAGTDDQSQAHQLPRQRQVQHQQNRSSSSSRYNSPSSDSAPAAPTLLQRFEASESHPTQRGDAQNSSRGSRGAHRGGRGRGGGGPPHQPLSNRISTGAPAVSLLQRIDQG